MAWAGSDPTRGLYGGRSQPSAVREVIVPPATPPDLSPLSWRWPGGALTDVQIEATTLAPLAETPLGPHRLRIDVLAELPDGTTQTLFTHPPVPGDGDRLGSTPPDPGVHGVWQQPAARPAKPHCACCCAGRPPTTD